MSAPTEELKAVTGVQLAQGIGHQPTRGFWTEAWDQIIRRPAAVIGMSWVAIIAFFAIFAPLIANGHPLMMWELDESGNRGEMSSPLLNSLSAADVVLLFWGFVVPIFLVLPMIKLSRSERLRALIAGGIQSTIITVLAGMIYARFSGSTISDQMRAWEQSSWFVPVVMSIVGLIAALPFIAIAIWVYASVWRSIKVVAISLIVSVLVGMYWSPALEKFEYRQREAAGEIETVYTLVPYSPNQSSSTMYNREPGATQMTALWDKFEGRLRLDNDHQAMYSEEELVAMPIETIHLESLERVSRSIAPFLPEPIEDLLADIESENASGELPNLLSLRDRILGNHAQGHLLGTDTLGQDVLSQMLHACRLSVSIGLVSTSIAVTIGVTIGAIMGYFGGVIDLLLYRVVEVFMAIPVLFLLIVAASVLPRNTYVMMAIIGCFTWTGAARFIRAEFMKLRDMDYIQSAQAMGLPLRSILFKHMLPNGVTPVLVEASFLIAAAILIEATLSYLGLGPSGQASWGLLLSSAIGDTGVFVWWLAIFPGGAIFLTTLAYNLIGEALRDAVDPKLKKARV
jgi:ABC-type dipeptide/oligopeptide/nickel transport system permease subunit